MEELVQIELPGLVSLSEESHLAGKVKKEQPILVILGNPPYSGHSANTSEKYITIKTKMGKEKRQKIKTWIGELINDYKFVDGKALGEKKIRSGCKMTMSNSSVLLNGRLTKRVKEY